MKITKIEQQKKRKHWYSIFVDGAFEFSLPESQLVTSGLKTDVELSESELREWKAASTDAKLYDRVLSYLAIRPRSEKEIRDYLWRKEIVDEQADSVVSRLYEEKYLDDDDFARRWVEYRNATKPSSKRKLQMELRKKGIAALIIDTILAEDDGELERLNMIIEKKRSRYNDKQKFMAYLASQGFNYDMIKQALVTKPD